ncbi:hypothetical protein [Oceanobacillus indicireducens]|uniref:Uncharacterized protein n=1 Tax=Oceanobacillus indicireducens TaxID=1004261 RepID=A0A918D4K6_9BACI|nr:hypothetical protein [Oceanobacillus indicireducens]GGN64422.1 hypothetical protein GCM10007971_32300 [Oceanobacillus indicireducens]
MRQERPLFADIYPAGKYKCGECGSKNLLGESFHYRVNFLSQNNRLCPDCYRIQEQIKKEKQRQAYASGEEEPEWTDEITCPWCGYELGDSWELADSDDECECNNCDKIFSYERHIEVTYSSSRVEED